MVSIVWHVVFAVVIALLLEDLGIVVDTLQAVLVIIDKVIAWADMLEKPDGWKSDLNGLVDDYLENSIVQEEKTEFIS